MTNQTASRKIGRSAQVEQPEEKSKDTRLLLDQAYASYKEYGAYTIENRALGDVRDGLKPVQRRILWAMMKMGLKNTGSYVKAARVVGDVMGKYHPHGDKSIYDAMVNMAGTYIKNTTKWRTKAIPQPFILGAGNWGDHDDPPAAPRYTECRLTDYAVHTMLDPEYASVMPMIANYDDKDREPVLLPAKLPNILINGSYGVAVGVNSNIPSFTIDSVAECAAMAIEGTLKNAKLLKTLVPTFPYGGLVVDEEQARGVFKEGRGTVLMRPTVKYEPENGCFVVTSLAPRLNTATIRRAMTREGTVKIADETGPDGFRFSAYHRKGMDSAARKDWAASIRKGLIAKLPVNLNATVRDTTGGATFISPSLLEIFQTWAEWRIEIEKLVLLGRIDRTTEKMDRTGALIMAVDNMPIIVKSLEVEDSVKFLMKKLQLTEPLAKYLIEQPLYRFRKLDANNLRDTKKQLASEVKSLKQQHATPKPTIISDLESISKKLTTS